MLFYMKFYFGTAQKFLQPAKKFLCCVPDNQRLFIFSARKALTEDIQPFLYFVLKENAMHR